jgi:hypothetical protein
MEPLLDAIIERLGRREEAPGSLADEGDWSPL